MLAPQVMVPLPPPLTLKAEAEAAPVMEPPVVPHVPVTPVRLTLPAVAVTLLNVPLTAPVVRLRALTPLMLFAAPLTVSVPKVLPVMLAPVDDEVVSAVMVVEVVAPPARFSEFVPPVMNIVFRFVVGLVPEVLTPVAAPLILTLLMVTAP